ncbi:hypothetical protein FHG87_022901 [Trinorchestia longiramus]|nr:hypothetical protein FHG87_022901 [Trinorchestia longiramus]
MNVRCKYCDALRFRNEDKNCYHNGKVSVPALQPYPEALRDLLEGNDQEFTSFRKNIRNYNCAFSFASFGVKLWFPLDEVSIASASKARLITQLQICTLVMVNRNMGNCIL